MARWLMYAGFGLLASAAGYTLYTSATRAGGLDGSGDLFGLLLTLGIVLSIGGAALQHPRGHGLGRWLCYAGCALVAVYVGQALVVSATLLTSDPSPANIFNAAGMLGMLLALGGSAAQRSRA